MDGGSPTFIGSKSNGKVRSSSVWDVKITPAIRGNRSGGGSGKFRPSLPMGLRKKVMRISIEIHCSKGSNRQNTLRPSLSGTDLSASLSGDSEEDATLISMDRNNLMMALLSGEVGMDGHKQGKTEKLFEGETVVFRIMRPAKAAERNVLNKEDDGDDLDDDFDDDRTLSTLGFDAADEDRENEAWIDKIQIELSNVFLLKRNKSVCDVEVRYAGIVESRQIFFQSENEAQNFQALVKRLKRLDLDRSQRPTPKSIPPPSPTQEEQPPKEEQEPEEEGEEEEPIHDIQILVEIVSATDLPSNPDKLLDPYCVITMNEHELHRTQYIPNATDPIWTIRTGSHFLISCTADDFHKDSRGILFEIQDYSTFMVDASLGSIRISQEMMLHGIGDRKEFLLESVDSQLQQKETKLALRFRPATEEDISFMLEFEESKSEPSKKRQDDLDLKSPSNASFAMERTYRQRSDGVKEFLVRPHPDPRRPIETQWMTPDSIIRESLQPSCKWIQVGSGQTGKLYFEILGCQDLHKRNGPHDSAKTATNTDTFATLVLEDSVVSTDIIHNTSSPRWVPWSRRAFIFNISHPTSQLFLGLYDYNKSDGNPFHDPIGRIVINICSLRSGTEYMLQYKLYSSSSKVSLETSIIGSVHVRAHVEWDSERKPFFSSLRSPPDFAVNIAQVDNYRLASYTTSGKFNQEPSTRAIVSYIQELRVYKEVLKLWHREFLKTIFWRGRLFRSFFIFIMGIILVEFPAFIPAVLVGSFGFILVSGTERRSHHPHRWKRGWTYFELLRQFIFGRAVPQTIAAYENEDLVRASNQKYQKRIAASASGEQYTNATAGESLDFDLESPEDDDANSAISDDDMFVLDMDFFARERLDISLNPLKPVVYPLQKALNRSGKMPVEQNGFRRSNSKFSVGRSNNNSNSNSNRSSLIRSGSSSSSKKQDSEMERNSEEEQSTVTEIRKVPRGKQQQPPPKLLGRKDTATIPSNQLAPMLYSLQNILGQLCYKLRIFRSIILWDNCYYSFWISTASILTSLLLAALAFVVPWGLVFLWSARILVWGLLGPWMRFFYYFVRRKNHQSNELLNNNKEQRKKNQDLNARIRAENAEKLVDMKKYLFGNFILNLPRLSSDQHRDVPMISSEAFALRNAEEDCQVISVYGQDVDDDIIPNRRLNKEKNESADCNNLSITSEEEISKYHNGETLPLMDNTEQQKQPNYESA